jgi:hypothetical protein
VEALQGRTIGSTSDLVSIAKQPRYVVSVDHDERARYGMRVDIAAPTFAQLHKRAIQPTPP